MCKNEMKRARVKVNIGIVLEDGTTGEMECPLLVTKSFPNVVSVAEILPLSPFSTSINPKPARPLESFPPCTW
jgi:hypothetical protein